MSCAARIVIATLAMLLFARPAFAYIGPGAGLGVLAAFWALLTAVVSSVAFLILWPFRNRLRRRKTAPQAAASDRQAERHGGGTGTDGGPVG